MQQDVSFDFAANCDLLPTSPELVDRSVLETSVNHDLIRPIIRYCA